MSSCINEIAKITIAHVLLFNYCKPIIIPIIFFWGGGGNDLLNPRKQVVTFFSQACLAGNCILISIY